MNGFAPVMRGTTMLMFAAICFGWLVPGAVQRHKPGLAIGISALFVLYAIANVFVWRRMRRRV